MKITNKPAYHMLCSVLFRFPISLCFTEIMFHQFFKFLSCGFEFVADYFSTVGFNFLHSCYLLQSCNVRWYPYFGK